MSGLFEAVRIEPAGQGSLTTSVLASIQIWDTIQFYSAYNALHTTFGRGPAD
jgi:hypothetical protein